MLTPLLPDPSLPPRAHPRPGTPAPALRLPPAGGPLHEGGPALVDVLSAWGREDVRAEVRAALEEVTRLRFHPGLRRGWAQARAEAAVREAGALARLEGARITDADLRALTMDEGGAAGTGGRGAAPSDPAAALAVGIWRSQWGLVERMAPLDATAPRRAARVPLPALVAGVHRDICSLLVGTGAASVRVAIPRDPGAMRTALGLAGADTPDLPALVAVAALVAHFRVNDVFAPGSRAVGAALARWVLWSRGVDPTGVVVLSALDDRDPWVAGRALAGWVGAGEDGIASWLVHVARSLAEGARVGQDVALRVQAGRLG